MRRIIITGLLAVALMLGAFWAWGGYFEDLLTGRAPSTATAGDGAFLAGLLLLDVFLPIPATAVLAALGMAFGPVVGGLIGTAGTMCAGALAYGLCRALPVTAAKFLIGEKGLAMGEKFFAGGGGWVIALSRWTILLPELLSGYAGLVRMPARDYFAALFCGAAPMSFTYAWLGATAENKLLTLGLSAAVPVLLWGTWRWGQRRSEKSPDED